MRYLLALLLLTPAIVLGGTVVIQWQPPTERTDGTPLLLNEIQSYVLRQDGVEIRNDIPPTDVQVTLIDVTPGDYCFDMATIDTGARQGPFSAEVCKNVPPPIATPGAPTVTTITIIQ